MEQIGLSAVFDMGNFDRGIDSYIKSVKQATDTTDKAGGKFGAAFDTIGRKVSSASVIIGKTLVTAAAAAAVAMGAFVANGVKGAMDLSSQMGGIAAMMGLTKEAVGPLKDLIFDLGLDPTLKVNATEAADAIEMLGANGLTMSQIMDGAAKATVLLANSTGADFSTAADVATDTMALFNIEAGNMMEAVNGITGVTVASKFDINDYRLALAQAGGVASSLGVNFDDFNTVIAGNASLFASGSDAGTSFKTMLLRLVPTTSAAMEAMSDLELTSVNTGAAMEYLNDKGVKPVAESGWDLYNQVATLYYAQNDLEVGSEKAAEAFSKWAAETGLLQSAFFDANGQMKDMDEISVVLNKALAGLSEVEKSKALNTIFGTDAMRAAIGLAGQGEVAYTDQKVAALALGVSYDSLTGAMEGGLTKFEALQIQLMNTSAADAAKVRMDNLKGSLEILQGMFDTIGLQIGFAFLPLLKALADRLGVLVSEYAPPVIAFFENFAKKIEELTTGANWREVFPAWVVATIDTITKNSDLLLGALGGLAALLATAGLAAAFAAIGAAIAAILSPIGLLIIGAMALGAAWNTNFLGIKEATLAVLEPITSYISAIADAGITSTEAREALTLFPKALQPIIGGFMDTVAGIGAYISAVNDAGTESIEAQEALTLFPGWLQGIAKGALDTVIGLFAYIGAIREAGFSSIEAEEALSILPDSIEGIVKWVASLRIDTDLLMGAVGGLAAALAVAALPTVFAAIGGAMAAVGAAIGAILSPIGLLIIGAVALGAAWNTNFLGMKDLTIAAFDAITSAIEPLTTAIATFGTGALAEIVAFVTGNTTEFTNLKAIWAGLVTTVQGILTSVVAAITASLPNWIAGIQSLGASIGTTLLAFDYVALGQGVMTLIQQGWDAAVALILPSITALGTSISTTLKAVNWLQLGMDILTAIRDGWNSVVIYFAAVATNLGASIGTTLRGVNWLQLGMDILTGIRDGWNSVVVYFAAVATNLGTSIGTTLRGVNWLQLGKDILEGIQAGWDAVKELATASIGVIATALKAQFGESVAGWQAAGKTILDNISAGIESAKETTLTAVSTIATAIKDRYATPTGIDWKTVGGDITTAIQTGLSAAANIAGGLLAAAATIATSVKDAFTTLTWSEIGTLIVNEIKASLQTAVDAAGGLMATVKKIGEDIVSSFSDIDWLEVGHVIARGIKTGFSALVSGIGGLIPTASSAANSVGSAFSSIDWSLVGQTIINAVIVGIKLIAYGVAGLAVVAGEIAKGMLEEFTGLKWQDMGSALIESIKTGITTATATFLIAVGTLATDMLAKFTAVDWLGTGTAIIAAIEKGITDATEAFLRYVGTVASDTLKLFTDIKWTKIGEGIIDGIKKGIQDSKAKLTGYVTQFLQDILPDFAEDALGIGSPSKVFATMGREIVMGLIQGIKNASGQLLNTMRALLGNLSDEQLLALDIQVTSAFTDRADEIISAIESQISKIGTAAELEAERIELLDKLAEAYNDDTDRTADIAELTRKLEDLNTQEAERLRLTSELAALGELQANVAAFKEQQKSIALFEDYIALLTEASSLGIDISRFNAIPDDTLATTAAMLDLEREIAAIRQEQLRLQATNLQQYLAEIRLEAQRKQGLEDAMRSLQPLIDASSTSSIFGQKYQKEVLDPLLKKLEQIAGSEDERNALIAEYAQMTGKLQSLAYFENEATKLEQRVNLLKQAADLGIDISQYEVNYDGSVAGLTEMVELEKLIAQYKIGQLQAEGELLKRTVQQAKEEKARKEAFKNSMIYLQSAIDAMSEVSGSFAQRARDTLLDPIIAQLEKVADIESERVELLSQYRYIADRIGQLQYIEKEVALMTQHVSLLQEASKLGIDISKIDLIPSDTKESLLAMVELERQVAIARYENLISQSREIKNQQQFNKAIEQAGIKMKDLESSNPFVAMFKSRLLEPIVVAIKQIGINTREGAAWLARYIADASKLRAIVAQESRTSFLAQQVDLLEKAIDLGIDVDAFWNKGFIGQDSLETTEALLELTRQISEANEQSLLDQLKTIRELKKNEKGLKEAMEILQPIIDQTNVSSAFGQRYKATVLDPILRALEKAAGIDSERVRLINEYKIAAEKLIELAKQEEQLDYLQQQLDLVKLIEELGLDGSIFDGITLGIDASIDDLIALVSRTLEEMISQIKEDLGIHSPSAVFAGIGKQMMAGLGKGIMSSIMQPLSALRQSTLAHGNVSTRVLNFAMGGVNINTPMDEVMFESRVLRILERAL